MKYLEILRARLDALNEQRDAAITDMETRATAALDEKRDLTPEDEAAITTAKETVAKIDEQRAELDKEIAEFEAIETRTAEVGRRPELQVIKPVEVDPGVDVRYMRPTEARDMALKVMDDKDSIRHLRTDQLDQMDRLVRTRTKNTDGAEIARRLLVTEDVHYRTAWAKLMTQSQAILTMEENRAVQRYLEFRAASLTSAAGGYGVPVLIDPTIVMTAQGSLNPFRRVARVEQITTNIWKGVSSAGVSWSYDSEAAAVSDDAATLAQPSVTTYMARGFIPYSYEIGEDYPGFAEEMAKLLTEGLDELEAQQFATGSTPVGIITAIDQTAGSEVAVTTDGAFGGVDVNKVWGALPDRFKQNATWMMNHDVGNEISTFSATDGPGSFFTGDLREGNTQRIKGRPVEYASHFPDFSGTTGAANILIVGDFRHFLIAERVGMEVELIPNLFDVTNNRPTGQRGWFAHARHGSDSIADEAFRLLQNT